VNCIKPLQNFVFHIYFTFSRYSSKEGNEFAAVMERATVTAIILDKLATMMSVHTTFQFASETLEILKRIFKDSANDGTLHLYFLQQIQPSEALFSLLKSDLLGELELSQWRVCEGIEAKSANCKYNLILKTST
jgi:hypothetical protein